MSKPEYNAKWFIETLHGVGSESGGHVVLWRPSKNKGGVSYWHPAAAAELVQQNVDALRDQHNLYVGVCLQDQAAAVKEKQRRLYAKAAKTGEAPGKPDIRYMRGFSETVCSIPGVWFELDYLSEAGTAHKKADLPTKQEAAAFVKALPLRPSVAVYSGNGLHLYWLFPRPIATPDEGSRRAAARLVERWQTWLHDLGVQHGWNFDATHDLTRVLRLPGTLNHKTTPPRPVGVWFAGEERYTVPQIERVLPAAAPAEPERAGMDDDRVAELLRHIPPRPEYTEWIRVVAATLDACGGDERRAESLLMAWSPEEEKGEYADKLGHALERVSAGTLVYMARSNGWEPKSDPAPEVLIGGRPAARPGAAPAATPTTAAPTGDGAASKEDAAPAPAVAEKPQEEEKYQTWPYMASDGRLYFLREQKDGRIEKDPIADFDVRIVREVVLEEGTRIYTLRGKTVHGEGVLCEIGAEEFEDERHLKKVLGGAAGAGTAIYKGMTPHLPAAIHRLSQGGVRRTRRFQRTGWQDGHFLIPGREPEGVEIELSSRVLPYRIHPEAQIDEARTALRGIMESHGARAGAVILSHLFLPPLGRVARLHNQRYALLIHGLSGSLKTSLAQTAMCLYGPGFIESEHLIKWGEGATSNGLMGLATKTHDLPLYIDNFKRSTGGGSNALISFVHNALEGGEKIRATRDAGLRDTREIHTWPFMTGEDVPDTDPASIARMLILRLSYTRGEHNAALQSAQDRARHLSAAGAAWLAYLESDEGQETAALVRGAFPERRQAWAVELRRRRSDMVNPLRVASSLALNELGLRAAARCPALADVLTPYLTAHQEGLSSLAYDMANYGGESREAARYLSALREAVQSGEARLLKPSDDPASAMGRAIGFIDPMEDDTVFLLPQQALRAAARVLGDGSLDGISIQSLYAQLDELGAFAAKGADHTAKQKKIAGRNHRCLWIKAHLILGEGADPADEEAPF